MQTQQRARHWPCYRNSCGDQTITHCANILLSAAVSVYQWKVNPTFSLDLTSFLRQLWCHSNAIKTQNRPTFEATDELWWCIKATSRPAHQVLILVIFLKTTTTKVIYAHWGYILDFLYHINLKAEDVVKLNHSLSIQPDLISHFVNISF